MSKIKINCDNCNKVLFKSPCYIKQVKNHFCCRACKKSYYIDPKVIKERFMSHVEIIDENTWIWKSGKDNHGYGQFRVSGKTRLAHRYSYKIFIGEIPEGLFVLHRYDDNPLNICPKNLWLGTHSENMRDMIEKGRSSDQRGERSSSVKLTNDKVLRIREMHKKGCHTVKELSKIFNAKASNIYCIIERKSWKHI